MTKTANGAVGSAPAREVFLPVSRADMQARGWEQLDFLLVSGDAYVDHPSFGHAIIARVLEREGYRVGILAQPDFRSPEAFLALGRPRLGVLVSAGNLDSMLNAFTAAKKRRHTDSYSPGNRAGLRPERATIVYCNRVRQAMGDIPVVIGGIEASLRRVAHYDYWDDAVRRSILVDSGADLLVYGMGELQVAEIARQLALGIRPEHIRDVAGTCWMAKEKDDVWVENVELPSFESVASSRTAFTEAFSLFYLEQDPVRGKTLLQAHGSRWVVQNPPTRPLSTPELDSIYDLPFARLAHPDYSSEGGVPAIQEVQFSLVSHRGCFGSCSFCAITSHQGRIIQSRSKESLLREAALLAKMPGFKGYIHDVGGPTANFRHPSCEGQLERGTCRGRECLGSRPCPNLDTDHSEYLDLLRAIRALPGVKKVFVRSGIRYDYLLAGEAEPFLTELCRHHVSGQLKVAPEHVSKRVTDLMGKSGVEAFLAFSDAYSRVNSKLGKEQYLVPYFMSSHPGSTLSEAVELAEFLRDTGMHPEQVQDFIPTPGTLSTCMYYTGINPLTGERVPVARSAYEKRLQRALLQYRDPKNADLVREALARSGREDLIGTGPKCLVRPAGQFAGRGMRNAPEKGKRKGGEGVGKGKNRR
jgi:uncharacterized radical SAM protein YgiQ